MSLGTSHNVAVLPPPIRSSWRGALVRLRPTTTSQRLVGGSLIMLLGSTMVSGINFGYNMVTAHLLGPTEFGHASVAVTMLMLASAITLAFQMVCAKFVARNQTLESKLLVMRHLRKNAWLLSMSLAVVLALFSQFIADYLRLPSRAIVLLLALGILFYIPLGVKRGTLQGMCDFPRLTYNFLLETSVKFLSAVVLILLLLRSGVEVAVLGAVAAVTISVIVAYFLPPLTPALRSCELPRSGVATIPASFVEGMQASVFFVGQVLINNIDIVLVKHFFPPREAGMYAAVALVGRVLYFAAWSVVSAMFPIAAGSKAEERPGAFLFVPLLLVAAITSAFVVFTTFFPHTIMHAIFGPAFHGPAEDLLTFYAVATGLYALSAVLMTYEMSRKIANTAWLQLIFSGLVISGISWFHASLRQVINVQIALMLVLLALVSVPFLRVAANRNLAAQEAA